MTKTINTPTYDYAKDEDKPKVVSGREWTEIAKRIATFPHKERRRHKLFATRFPVTGGTLYVVFTEKIDDAVMATSMDHGEWVLEFSLGATMPDGAELVPSEPLTDIDWDCLARQPRYRPMFSETLTKRGKVLAGRMQGARFNAGEQSGEILVTSYADVAREHAQFGKVGIDIFVRPQGSKRLRWAFGLWR